MDDIKVSVIVPVYNQMEYIKTCILSIQNQTLKDIEIICVDDASSDETPDIIGEFMRQDRRIRYRRNECNLGPGLSRNVGLDMAKGKYLIFLDSDDYFEKDMLRTVYDMAETADADMVIFSELMEREGSTRPFKYEMEYLCRKLQGEIFSYKDIPDLIFNIWAGWPWDKFMRTGFIRTNGIRYPDLRNSEDLCFVYAAMVKAERIVWCGRTFVHHRLDIATSVSATQHRHFECSLNAHIILKNELERMKIFHEVRRSFINEAISVLIFFYEGMAEPVQKQYYEYLKEVCFPELDLLNYQADYYYNQAQFRFCSKLSESADYSAFIRDNPPERCFSSAAIYEANVCKLRALFTYAETESCETVIWGAGRMGRTLMETCIKNSLKVDEIVDVDSEKSGLQIGECQVKAFCDLEDGKKLIIVPNIRYFNEVCSEVRNISHGHMLINLPVYLNYPFTIPESSVVV